MRKIGALILAAGDSTRLGQPKQLLEWRGETLIHATVRVAQEGGCDPVWVITGSSRLAVEEAVADLRPRLVHHAEWPRGIGSSLRRGLKAAHGVSAVVVLTCDQPAVDATVVRALIARHEQAGCAIVASAYAGTRGIPALFATSCFSELQKVPDDRGAKPVIEADPSRVATLDFPAGVFDLDSPRDLEIWRASGRARAEGLPRPS